MHEWFQFSRELIDWIPLDTNSHSLGIIGKNPCGKKLVSFVMDETLILKNGNIDGQKTGLVS